ncbi:MAG: HPr family phosphocarrier protein [Spirochaetaceae bacterium]|nr:HPr family phosphocarrier protein [Spirochaetaceae bacterium]
MIEKHVTVKNRAGIHARPASLIVTAAGKFASLITLSNEAENETINAKSTIGVISLGARYNMTLLLRAEGPDEAEAIQAVADIFEQRFETED